MSTQKAISFQLPLGPTDNRRHVISRNGRFLIDSTEYREWKAQAITFLVAQKGRYKGVTYPLSPSYEECLKIRVKVFIASKRVDHTNYLKSLLDVLTQSGVWTDDRWIVPLFDTPEVDKENPRVVVSLTI